MGNLTLTRRAFVFYCFKVDLVKTKDRLLDITTDLTCGVVNGCKIQVRPVIKPPWAEKKPEKTSGVSSDEDNSEPDFSSQEGSTLSKERLKELRGQRGWPHFKDVFMLSSLDKDDVETLKVNDLKFALSKCKKCIYIVKSS